MICNQYSKYVKILKISAKKLKNGAIKILMKHIIQ